MATIDPSDMSDVYLWMQQHGLVPAGGEADAPSMALGPGSTGSENFADRSLGRLLELQTMQGQYQPSNPIDGQTASQPYDSNFRQVSRAPLTQLQRSLSTAGMPIVSDASPDPVKPGAQYAQFFPPPATLCATGFPPACGVGLGLTAAEILGAAALAGSGALIMNNKNKGPSQGDPDEGSDASKGSGVPKPDSDNADAGTNNASDELNNSNGKDPDNYNPVFEIFRQCMQGARRFGEGKPAAWTAFCKAVPDTPALKPYRETCHNILSQSEQYKNGWCRESFGNESSLKPGDTQIVDQDAATNVETDNKATENINSNDNPILKKLKENWYRRCQDATERTVEEDDHSAWDDFCDALPNHTQNMKQLIAQCGRIFPPRLVKEKKAYCDANFGPNDGVTLDDLLSNRRNSRR